MILHTCYKSKAIHEPTHGSVGPGIKSARVGENATNLLNVELEKLRVRALYEVCLPAQNDSPNAGLRASNSDQALPSLFHNREWRLPLFNTFRHSNNGPSLRETA